MRTRTARAARRGFTLIEILIVVVMISLLALVAVPRFANASARRHMESARMRVATGLATARQAAIQKGQTVEFKIFGNRVTVETGGTNLMSPAPLDTLYKVSASVDGGSSLTVQFSARGFATSPGVRKVITLTRSGVPNDSVVVTKFGMVQR